MRPVFLPGRPAATAPIEQRVNWLMDAVQKIADAANVDPLAISDPFQVTSLDNTNRKHTLDVATANLSDVSRVLATLLADMKRRGVNSGIG